MVAVSLYLLALAARVPFLFTPIYGDEAVQYTMARHWGNYESRGTELTTGQHVEYGLVFWQRPAFPTLLSPGALFGFMGMRIELMLLTGLFAPLGFEALRRMNVHVGWAAAGGAAVAIHPILALWGTRVFPDALAAVFLLAALVADQQRRFEWAAALLVLSAWSKEVVIPAVVAFGILRLVAYLRARKSGSATRWRPLAMYAGAIALAPIPLLYVLSQDARLPGWTFSGEYMVARLFVGLWTVPFVVYLLVKRPFRHLPWLAIGFPLLFIADHFVRKITIEEWYFVLPNLFVLLAVPAALHHMLTPALKRLRASRPQAARAVMVALMLLVVVLPSSAPPTLVNMGFAESSRTGGSYFETFDVTKRENADFPPTVAFVRAELPSRLVLINPAWYNIEYPWAGVGREIRYVYTPAESDSWPYDTLDDEMRRPNTITVFHRLHPVGAVFMELEERYRDCILHDLPAYFVVRARECRTEPQPDPVLPLG